MKKPLHIYILEEHHEAFFTWKYAIENNIIYGKNHTLLHIDEHSDMGSPLLNKSLNTLNNNLQDILKFTYQELNISTFILPAIYQGIFNNIVWINHNGSARKANKLYVRTVDDKAEQFIIGEMSMLENFYGKNLDNDSTIVPFNFYIRYCNGITRLKNVLLDIDLDYFSCMKNPTMKELKIEITKQEYLNYQQTHYHKIRFYDLGRIELLQKDGRYYYCINNYMQKYVSPLKVTRKKINERIGELAVMLEKQINPQIITICRSRFSGFTPEDQWEYIEKKLLKVLSEIYTVSSIQHISELSTQKI